MGVVDFFSKSLSLAFFVNSYVALLIPIIIYYTIFKKYDPNVKIKIPFLVKELLIILLIGWITSSWLAMYSTISECGNFSILWTLLIGLITPAFLWLGLLLVRYFIPFLKKPAKILFVWVKSPVLQDSLITGFYMMLCSWMGSIITHFLAIDEGCRLNRDDMKKFRSAMENRKKQAELEPDDDDEEKETVTI